LPTGIEAKKWYFGKMAWPETKNMPKISFSLGKINCSEP
jgi:hypothetical protein